MRKDYIPFLEHVAIDGVLYFVLTKQPITQDLFERLPQQKNFMALPNDKKPDHILLCTDTERLICCRNNDGLLLIKGTYELDFYTHNKMMRYGVPIVVEETVVEVKSTERGIYELFTSTGTEDLKENSYSKAEAVENAAQIFSAVRTAAAVRDEAGDNEEEAESYQPHKKLERMLALAEHYANMESDFAAKAAQENRLFYKRIEPLEYERSDRTAYAFITEEFPGQNYRLGTQVQIEGCNEQPYTAEVIQMPQEGTEEEHYLGLLFNGQIGVDAFEASGWISPSFSTVIRDVQLVSIEKIRGGKAAAKYMDAVLGEYKPAGFDEVDLAALEQELNAKKYPPTESQMQAIKNGIRAKDAYLVMGPPGTGKTTVILAWVRYFVQQGKRVLISSQNNKAVDNVLGRLANERGINMIRIGSEAKVEADVRPYLFENKVEAARTEIAEKTEKNLAIAESLRKNWQALQEELPVFAADLARYEQENSLFLKELDASLLSCGNEMQACHAAYKEVCTATDQQRQAVRQRYAHIRNLPAAGILGFFTPIRRFFARGPMRREVQKYDALREKELAAAAAYNAARDRYESLFQYMYENNFVPLQTFSAHCQKMHAELQEQAAQASYDKTAYPAEHDAVCDAPAWDFFPLPFPSMNAKEAAAYTAQVTADFKRLERFTTHLKEWKEHNENRQDYSLQHMILESVDLVGATCIGVSSQKRFADLKFDVTIIDEAGQIQIHNALVPMSVSNKLIMLGDHKQIPPSADQALLETCEENGVKSELLKISLFEKLYEKLPDSNKTILDTQFRMPPEIAAIISQEFYGGAYHSLEGWKKQLLSSFPTLSKARLVVIDTSDESARLEQKTAEGGTYNTFEATIVMRLVRGMRQCAGREFNSTELGIISAYKAQVKKIRAQLEGVLDEEERREAVATLDSFQGQERDIIIYSFTRSSLLSAKKRRIGFLNELRRLNVAMTRCKKMLILVGDMRFLASCEHAEYDDDGNVPEKSYLHSEARFSAFMRALLDGVKNGVQGLPPGEFIPYTEFERRMEEIEDD